MKRFIALLVALVALMLSAFAATAQTASTSPGDVVAQLVAQQMASGVQTEKAPTVVVVKTVKGPTVLLRIQHCGFHDTGWVCQYLDHPAPVPYGNGYLYCLSDYRWHWLVCN